LIRFQQSRVSLSVDECLRNVGFTSRSTDVLRNGGRVESNRARDWDHPASLSYDRSRIFNRQFNNPRIHPMPFSMSQASLPSFEISLNALSAILDKAAAYAAAKKIDPAVLGCRR
jgi:hypothetical protein